MQVFRAETKQEFEETRGLMRSAYAQVDHRMLFPRSLQERAGTGIPSSYPRAVRQDQDLRLDYAAMRRTAVTPRSLLSLCLLASGPRQRRDRPGSQALAAEVARTAAASGALGVNIVELDTGETVFSHHPDEPRVIASNSKLFTTAAALDALGPGYFFETRFLMRGAVERRRPRAATSG